MYYDYRKKSKSTKSSQTLKPLFFFILLIFTLFLSFKIKRKNLINIKTDNNSIDKTQSPPKNFEELQTKIKEIIDKQTGTYSVYFEDLKSGKNFGINEETIFTAASVNKIPILASLYYLAQKQDIDLDKKITIQRKDIQDYGTGTIRYQESGQVYSLKTLARLMMEKSDNTASYILGSQIITLPKIQELIESWDLTQTNIEENKTSNKDIAKLLKMMFLEKIAGKSLTLEMIGFMDDSDFEDRLPALIPNTTKVFHKIGNEIGFVHDVGIIDLENKPYYLGILTSDTKNEEKVKQIIAQISKLVFDFQKNQ